jgi:hypothetical protein
MKTTRTITARLYTLTTRDMRHDLTAISAADLVDQVQQITSSRQAAQLARIAWADDQADINAASLRLVATGQVVREIWKTLSPIRGSQPMQAVPAAAANSQRDEEPAIPAVTKMLAVQDEPATSPAAVVQVNVQAAAPTRQPPPQRREQPQPPLLDQADHHDQVDGPKA